MERKYFNNTAYEENFILHVIYDLKVSGAFFTKISSSSICADSFSNSQFCVPLKVTALRPRCQPTASRCWYTFALQKGQWPLLWTLASHCNIVVLLLWPHLAPAKWLHFKTCSPHCSLNCPLFPVSQRMLEQSGKFFCFSWLWFSWPFRKTWDTVTTW